MIIKQRKTQTVIFVDKDESALYVGKIDGEPHIGVTVSEVEGHMTQIDAALQGIALRLTTDPKFVESMARFYADICQKAEVQP